MSPAIVGFLMKQNGKTNRDPHQSLSSFF